MAELTRELRDTQKDNLHLKERNADLKESNIDLKESNIELKESNIELKESISELKKTHLDLSSQTTVSITVDMLSIHVTYSYLSNLLIVGEDG